MLERLLWVIALAAFSGVLLVSLRLTGLWLRRSLVGHRVQVLAEEAREDSKLGTILYFSGPDCVDCKWRQEPALQELQERKGGLVRVVALDALADHELARRFRVLTVPTTVVLDQDQRVRAVNYGFAPAEQLEEQILSA